MILLVACHQGGAIDVDRLIVQAKAGDAAACRDLVDLLGQEENQVGAKVYPTVLEIGQPMVQPLLDNIKTDNRYLRERVIAALGTLQVVSAIEPVSQVLADKSLKRRYIAAWALGEIGGRAGIEPLLNALGDPEALVRQYATRSLIKYNRDAVQPLIDFVAAADEIPAAGAIRALGDIGDKRALAVLLNHVDGPNRHEAFLALGKLKDPQAESALISGLSSTDWQSRMNAAMALGPVGSAKSIVPLRGALDDEVMVVREWAARSLSVITGKSVMYRDAHGEMVEPYSVYH